MSFLKAVLFESQLAFWVMTALLMGVAYAMWLRAESARRRWVFPAAFSTVVGLYALQKLVTTERERLREAIEEVVSAVEARYLAGVMAKVANNFESDGMDRAAFEQYVRSAFQRTEISDTRISGVDVEIAGDEGRTTFTAAATVRLETGVQRLGSQWEVSWVRGADGWKMVRVRPQSVAGMQVNGLRSLRAW